MMSSSTRARRIPHIPLELVHEVLGYLHPEKRVLESCSLVCKAWVHPSRSHLFAKVTLDDELLQRFLASNHGSTIIPYIRHFHLKQSSVYPELWNDAIPDLVGFQRVVSVTMQNFSHHRLSAQARSLLFTQFSEIVRFCIIGSSRINKNQLVDTICFFPRLKTLVLHDLPMDWSTVTPGEGLDLSPRTISRHLHSLEIFDSDAMKLLTWILSFENLRALRALHLLWHSRDFRALNDLLPHMRFLERLSLSNEHLVFDRNGFIDLSRHEHLRFLHIRRIASFNPTRCVIQTLASITSTCMDELVFDVCPVDDNLLAYKDIEWSAVDTVLQSPQFSTLRKVQLNATISRPYPGPSSSTPIVDPEHLASFHVRLSQCHSRGILLVRAIVESELESVLLSA